MGTIAGAKSIKGGAKKGANALPLKARLLAKGIYKEQNNSSSEQPLSTPHLFSPIKPIRRSSKGNSMQKAHEKQQRPVMQSYFRRKSMDGTRASTSESNPKGSGQMGTFSFMLDNEEMEKVKRTSEAFFVRLTEEETDCSEVLVMDTSSLDQLAKERRSSTEGNVTTVPLVYNVRGVAYAMMKMGPRSHFGPLINTGGVMAIIFLDVPVGKIFYESLNLTSKRRLPCPRQSHVLILPDDVFKLYNDSDSVDASIMLLSCRKDGKEFNLEQHVQGAHQTPVR